MLITKLATQRHIPVYVSPQNIGSVLDLAAEVLYTFPVKINSIRSLPYNRPTDSSKVSSPQNAI